MVRPDQSAMRRGKIAYACKKFNINADAFVLAAHETMAEVPAL